TEHGRSGASSGFDEINRIKVGSNYGWPEIQGDETKSGMISPIKNSGAITTWAPAGAVFVENSLFFTGLRGATLYEAVIAGEQITDFREHFAGEYGRLRDVIVTSDGLLYIATSNHDGRGRPNARDDKLIRVNPQKL
ncbi:MAG: PQQ-dependent sugar dehydrogenase, partial [Acidobacteriota bacterium]